MMKAQVQDTQVYTAVLKTQDNVCKNFTVLRTEKEAVFSCNTSSAQRPMSYTYKASAYAYLHP